MQFSFFWYLSFHYCSNGCFFSPAFIMWKTPIVRNGPPTPPPHRMELGPQTGSQERRSWELTGSIVRLPCESNVWPAEGAVYSQMVSFSPPFWSLTGWTFTFFPSPASNINSDNRNLNGSTSSAHCFISNNGKTAYHRTSISDSLTSLDTTTPKNLTSAILYVEPLEKHFL